MCFVNKYRGNFRFQQKFCQYKIFNFVLGLKFSANALKTQSAAKALKHSHFIKKVHCFRWIPPSNKRRATLSVSYRIFDIFDLLAKALFLEQFNKSIIYYVAGSLFSISRITSKTNKGCSLKISFCRASMVNVPETLYNFFYHWNIWRIEILKLFTLLKFKQHRDYRWIFIELIIKGINNLFSQDIH